MKTRLCRLIFPQKIVVFACPLGLMLGIFFLSSIPGDVDGSQGRLLVNLNPGIQNLLHIPMFGLLQFFWLHALWKIGRNGRSLFLTGFFITITYGVLDEFHQLFVPGRYASMSDVVFNLIGICLGTLGFSKFIRFKQNRPLPKLR